MLVTTEKVDMDLYSQESLLNPFENYKMLRDLGSVVFLEKLNMYAAARYEDVRFLLANPEIFISGNGVTMNDTVNDALRGIGLCSDADEHRRIRKVEARPLNPRALRELRDTITSEAETVTDRVVAAKRFDAVTDLAQALPLSIVSNLVGVPEEGRERMLDWAAGNFNAFGPMSDRTSASMGVFGEMVNYAMTQCVPEKLKPGSWASMLHDAADAGEISPDEARLMALSYLAPSLDTTIFAISNGISLFAANPDQWDIVRENPAVIPNAINEILRLESPIQGFSRFAVQDHSFDEGFVPANSRIILLFGSANRDERRWEDPERFDVRRDRAGDHVAFGHGEHACIGMNLARMEISALLRHSKHDPYGDLHREEEAPAAVASCWLCSRPTGKTIVWHHPVPKSRGGRDVVPVHPICQQTLVTNFTNSELQRHGMDVEGLLANPNVRKFVDWVANKAPDFTATTAKKQR